MIDISPQLLYDLHVISEQDSNELLSIYEGAAQNLDLRSIDYCTIRDLVKIAGSNDVSLHLILIAMFVSLNEGSVCLKLSRESLEKKLKAITGRNIGTIIKTIQSNIEKFTELIHVKDATASALFNNQRDEYKPLILVLEGDSYYLYFQKYYVAEQKLKQYLSDIMKRNSSLAKDPDKVRSILQTVLHEKPLYINGAKAVLNDEQKQAVMLPLYKNFVLVSGGPGTGKTFLVLTLLRVLVRFGLPVQRIKIAAPTGRAARKLTEAIHRGIASLPDRDVPFDELAILQGTTIHRLLGYSPSRNDFVHNNYNKIRADIIIIDEASMIDLVLLGKLFEAVDEQTSILMLGDRNQLPSVEAGSVLAHLITDEEKLTDTLKGRIVLLHESYRSEQRIQAIAQGINTQDPGVIDAIPELKGGQELPTAGVWRIDPPKSGDTYYRDFHHMLDAWVSRYYSKKNESFRSLVAQASAYNIDAINEDLSACMHAIVSYLDEARILTPHRSGISGTTGINAYIAGRLGEIFDPAGRGKLFSGAPIIITKNDYDRELFNGDVGVILKGNNRQYYGVFRSLDGFKAYPAEALPPFELSYAITVHKSQGSEYGSVLFIISEGVTANLLTKEILYTGLTRAKKLVVLYASTAMLSQAIQNRIDRQSGLIV